MKKLVVDSINCIGCGACVGIDPKHFDFDDSGLSNVISQEDLNDESVNEAIAACPVSAISLVKDQNDDQEEKCSCGNNCTCENCDCNK